MENAPEGSPSVPPAVPPASGAQFPQQEDTKPKLQF